MRKRITYKQLESYRSFLFSIGFERNRNKSDRYSVTYSYDQGNIQIDVNIGTMTGGRNVEVSYRNLKNGERSAFSSFTQCLTQYEVFTDLIQNLLSKHLLVKEEEKVETVSDYKVIELSSAKDLYDNDVVVYALPSNIKLEDVLNGVREDVELFEISHNVYGDRWFNEIVSDYKYFSCDEENGEEVVFYTKLKTEFGGVVDMMLLKYKSGYYSPIQCKELVQAKGYTVTKENYKQFKDIIEMEKQ